MHATRHVPAAQCAFKILMIHEIVQFALRIAFRCVLHRCRNQDILRWKLYTFIYFDGEYQQALDRNPGRDTSSFRIQFVCCLFGIGRWRSCDLHLWFASSIATFSAPLFGCYVNIVTGGKPDRRWYSHAKQATLLVLGYWDRRSWCDNDPSAGSPTETLLRLHLPLSDKVQTSSHGHS